MSSAEARAAQAARLAAVASAIGRVLLALLGLLRPLVWSGDPTDLGNLLILALCAALAACGALHRAGAGGRARWSWPTALGAAFLGVAALGCWRSPYPADAWATWCGWALQIGAVVLAAPLVARHRRWVFAGLAAGLASECLLLVAQALWERPDLAQRLAEDPALVERRLRGQVLERVASWRLEGSFLLANTLAAYLILLIPSIAAVAWRALRARSRDMLWAAPLALGAVAALVRSGSKAGVLALAAAAAITAVVVARRRVALGWLLGAAVVLGVGLAVPALRGRLAASADVRVDYWRAAATLIRERPWTGHGLDGFRLHYPRVKPPRAEETIIAHQEILQAAVDCGIPAAVLLVAWWIAVLMRLRPAAAGETAARPLVANATRAHELAADGAGASRSDAAIDDAGPSPRAALATVIAIGVLAAYAVLAVGALGDRAEAWPGGAWLLVPVAAVALAIIARGARLAPPPRWAVWCGVLACLLHALADFHLHSAQVVGVLALLATAGSVDDRDRIDARSSSAARAPRLAWAAAALAVLLPTTLGIGWTAWRGQARERVRLAATALARLDAPAADERAPVALCAALAAYDLPATTDPQALARRAVADGLDEAFAWPVDPAAAMTVAAIAIHAGDLAPAELAAWTPTLATLVERWPDDLAFAQAWAAHARLRARDDPAWRVTALAAWRDVVALYPSHLPFRRALADVAESAGDHDEADRQHREIARLAPIVNAENR